jgi:hypothetical protein
MSREGREAVRVAVILGLVILLVYGDVAFLGFTLSPALSTYAVLSPPYGYTGRLVPKLTWNVIDPQASGGSIWPVNQLIYRTQFLTGLPLWNPFQGTGAPLAADTTWSTYFPLNFLYFFLPNQYWDFVWLLKLWIAGILCYLFLRRIGLAWSSATAGGLIYSLSGAFIFYPFLPWTDVAILTPAMLYAAKRCFDKPSSAGSAVLTGGIFGISLLGAHIEALIIQLLYTNLFALYEVLVRKGKRIHGFMTWIVGLTLGLGLAAFFLIPVFEYLAHSTLAHGSDTGIQSLSSSGSAIVWWVTLFVPYFYGFVQKYPYPNLWQVFFWDFSPGYLGAAVFFCSIIPIFSRKVLARESMRYYGFFVFSGILLLMKIFGIPPINWIGYLPVLNAVVFPRFSGAALAMSFAGAAAFGLESVSRKTDFPSKAFFIVLIAIGLPALASIPFPASPNDQYFHISLAYFALAIFFLVLVTLTASKGGQTASKVLTMLIVLELVSYIPRSLTAGFEAVRVTILAMGAVLVVGHFLSLPQFVFAKIRVPKISIPFSLLGKYIYGAILLTTLVLQFAVAGLSPMGIPNRYDPYTEPPYVSFLRANSGLQRVYSLDGVFFPPVAGVFSIESLGEFSAFMPVSFRAFSLMNLDNGSAGPEFVGNAWFRQEPSPDPGVQITQNLAFYSLLGVKYFVTKFTVPGLVNTESLIAADPQNYTWVPLGPLSTRIRTNMSFNLILVTLGTYGRTNVGYVTLSLDSVPFEPGFHRTTRIDAESINGVPTAFAFPEVRPSNRTEFMITLQQSDSRPGNEVAVQVWSQTRPNPDLTVTTGFPEIALAIASEELPIAYRDQNVTIYENPRVFPRAFLVNQEIAVNGETEAVSATRGLGWNTRFTAVIEGNPSQQPPMSLNTVNSSTTASIAEIEQYSDQEVTIKAEAVTPSYLILTDTFYPGWDAFVDGRNIPVYRAYGDVRAVFLTSGVHQVIFKYEPLSFTLGAAISIISAILGGILVIQEKRTSRRPKHRPRAPD